MATRRRDDALEAAAIRAGLDQIPAVFRDSPQYVHEGLSTRAERTVVVKVESINPIGSFKGRGCSLAITALAGEGTIGPDRPVVQAMTAALATEATKARMSRIALFEAKDVQERFLADACRAVDRSTIPCPLKLTMIPSTAGVASSGLWSKQFTEQEAIDERHLPTLIGLLAQEKSRVVRKGLVFALFMELAESAADLAKVAVQPRLLDDGQFNSLIERIISIPGAGNEALTVFASVTRLTGKQQAALREKAFREASVAHLIKHYGAGRITDSELAQLSRRLVA